MLREKKKKFVPVDYASRTAERRRLTNYLRADNCKKFGRNVRLRADEHRRLRWTIIGCALAILAVGVYYASR